MQKAECISAKSEITRLQSKIASLETSNKRARIDYEKEIQEVKYEKTVSCNPVFSLSVTLYVYVMSLL